MLNGIFSQNHQCELCNPFFCRHLDAVQKQNTCIFFIILMILFDTPNCILAGQINCLNKNQYNYRNDK